MHPGEARIGTFVYFAEEGEKPEDPPMRIARASVTCIIFPGTTNERYSLIELSSEGFPKSYDKSPEECYSSGEAARKAQILKIHLQLEQLRLQLQSLGDHTLTQSRWGRR